MSGLELAAILHAPRAVMVDVSDAKHAVSGHRGQASPENVVADVGDVVISRSPD